MSKRKRLSRRQLAVIEDLFAGELDEQAVLDKHRVGGNLYNRWLGDEVFCAALERRIASARRQSELIIAKYASLAAAKLVQLTASQSQETARKACLDIISLPQTTAKKTQGANKVEPGREEQPELSDETASRLLAVLAEEKKKMQRRNYPQPFSQDKRAQAGRLTEDPT